VVQELLLQNVADAFSPRPWTESDSETLLEIMDDLVDQATAELLYRLARATSEVEARAMVRSQPDVDLLPRVADLCFRLLGERCPTTARVYWIYLQVAQRIDDGSSIRAALTRLAWLCAADSAELVEGLSGVRGSLERDASLQAPLLDLHQAMYGPLHEVTLRTMARVARTNDDWPAAAQMLREVVRLSTFARGADHPETLHLQGGLAIGLLEHGDTDGAAALAHEMYLAEWSRHGAEHEKTAAMMSWSATVELARGRRAEALDLWRAALLIQSDRVGPRHPDATVTAFRWFSALDDEREARTLFESHLEWLLTVPADALDPVQREVLAHITTMMEAARSGATVAR
jgi:hypothetical protein